MDRIENQLKGKAAFVRVNVGSPAGLQVAQRYGVGAIPSLLLLDSQGNIVYFHTGLPSAAAVVAAVRELD